MSSALFSLPVGEYKGVTPEEEHKHKDQDVLGGKRGLWKILCCLFFIYKYHWNLFPQFMQKLCLFGILFSWWSFKSLPNTELFLSKVTKVLYEVYSIWSPVVHQACQHWMVETVRLILHWYCPYWEWPRCRCLVSGENHDMIKKVVKFLNIIPS